MDLKDLLPYYSGRKQAKALREALKNKSVRTFFLKGLTGSSAPVFFSSLADSVTVPFAFILQDADDAGYFYNDLKQILGQEQVLFFPSSYRRSVKYGQRDAANEVLRTEVLARLSEAEEQSPLFIVSYPEAIAELVVSKKNLDERILKLSVGQTADITETTRRLRDFSFTEVDYVYEPV